MLQARRFILRELSSANENQSRLGSLAAAMGSRDEGSRRLFVQARVRANRRPEGEAARLCSENRLWILVEQTRSPFVDYEISPEEVKARAGKPFTLLDVR